MIQSTISLCGVNLQIAVGISSPQPFASPPSPTLNKLTIVPMIDVDLPPSRNCVLAHSSSSTCGMPGPQFSRPCPQIRTEPILNTSVPDPHIGSCTWPTRRGVPPTSHKQSLHHLTVLSRRSDHLLKSHDDSSLDSVT